MSHWSWQGPQVGLFRSGTLLSKGNMDQDSSCNPYISAGIILRKAAYRVSNQRELSHLVSRSSYFKSDSFIRHVTMLP